MINIKEFLGLGYYTSKLDEFLAHFYQTHQKMSASQRAEMEKYNRIYKLRDTVTKDNKQKSFWSLF